MGLPLILENKTLDCIHGRRVMGQKVCARKWSATLQRINNYPSYYALLNA